MRQMKKGSLRKKLVLVMLPVVILSYLVTYLATFMNTKNILQDHAREQMTLLTTSVCNEMATDVNHILGIMENVKNSVEKSCTTEKEIEDYIYGVADAYPDIIPAGIYCGLCSGTYIDKLWTPDADWVMEERPWYQEGLKCDEVTFGEMYLDANTNQYIISAYTNIKDSSGNVIGVACADVAMDNLAEILTDATIFENGYVFAVDKVTGMIMGNSKEPDQNGLLIQDLNDEYSQKILSMIENGTFETVEELDGEYFCLREVPNSNFVTVCRATKADVEADLAGVQKTSMFTSLLGIVFLCVVMFVAISYFLNPITGIMDVINHMHALDLTERAKAGRNDEFGTMAESMNSLADNLHGVMGQMKGAITEIDGKADVNAGIATDMHEMAKQQTQALSKLINTMSELSGAINDIAEGTTRLTGNVVDSNAATSLVEKKVDESLGYINSGRGEMDKMTETMSEISDVSSDLQAAVEDVQEGLHGINAMVSVINDIADETRLLALNASIEAARAGEAGKGFAVVADEIRTLADDCANSVVDIVNTTQKMDTLVQVVTEKTTMNMEKIQSGNEVVTRTGETFQQINAVIEEISEAIMRVGHTLSDMESVATDMVASTEEQSANTESVLNDCEQVMHIAENFNAEGEEMASAGQQLKELSAGLASMVEKFKVN